MIFHPLPLAGAFLIEPEPIRDQRGFFARTVCRKEFAEHGLNAEFVQQSLSWNEQQGTLRGMHYQVQERKEAKLVRVAAGSIYDVLLDLRDQESTYLQWYSVELSAINRMHIYIPPGVAHGFLTLSDHCEVIYQMTAFYDPTAARGVRWDDPVFGIEWPQAVDLLMSAQDKSWPLWVRES
ncbi:dTDP-4-dehydrorhamnose 3,5-epimerase [Chitinibacter bivalviorum]|uniref:dTDP-4-dehydrorhamnose 3,5-epimerase n=1 Tax=Chitinibacter bivalviorum TaxID=2739434 RepID=A0A7H9BG39_9NEIS|nr:dTDP-4-dehydrorhamnose 3,5-epimerase [Chitinibacter bivalviorum]QLG87392.1 dTDP-4-dehydrorhamnose 3,5-epimerase [Chitinibacter bivalviorum]